MTTMAQAYSPSLSSFQSRHRDAMALNNEAVSLMQQGDFAKSQGRSMRSLNRFEELLASLEGEHQATAPEIEGNSAQRIESDSTSRGNGILASVEIHIVEEGDFCDLRAAVQYGSSTSIFFPVVLRDTVDLDTTTRKETLSRQYAAALLNSAILSILMQQQHEAENPPDVVLSAKLLKKMRKHKITDKRSNSIKGKAMESQEEEEDSTRKPAKLLRSAKRSLNRASAVLCAVASEKSQTPLEANGNGNNNNNGMPMMDDNDEVYTKNRIELMLVSALVLNCLAGVLKECQQPCKAKVALRASNSLQTLLEQDDTILPWDDMDNNNNNNNNNDDSTTLTPNATNSQAAPWYNTSVFAPVYISPAA